MNIPPRITHLPLPSALLALVIILCSPAATAASFPCAAAHTPQEHAICSDPELSQLDDHLAAAYKRLRTTLSPAAAAQVQSDQREWLLWLDKLCSTTAKGYRSDMPSCLTAEYNSRLRTLTDGYLQADGLVLYPRAHFVLVPHTPGTDLAPNDPGFGTGAFSWPQIDTPDANAAAWNRAVFNRVLARSSAIKRLAPTTLDATIDDGNEVDVFYHPRAVNRSILVVDLGEMNYGYGAAHPNTGIVTFSWWLTQQRTLTSSDIFAADSAWKTRLPPLICAKLKASLAGYFLDNDQTRSAIADSMNSVDSWNISSSGLTISFGQYAVAPYVAGMPSASFSWAELKPWLNSAFNPATLPPPIPQP